MGAICGIINFVGQPVDETSLVSLRDAMQNRGPGYGGIFLQNNVGLGHRERLGFDFSSRIVQPLANENQTVWSVLSGEIYNLADLRSQLEKCGHQFQSQADAEVVVHGYEEWGEDIFRKLNGMFAIGIWDSLQEKLILARDRFGKRPLFFMEQNGVVQFASEIKALWQNNRAQLSINPQAIDCYLHHLSTTQEHCIYNEVAKIKPAHYRVFTRDGAKETRYWLPSFREKEDYREAAAIDAVNFQLGVAVQRRLIGDEPPAAFLSGGINSGLVVALMSKISSKPVKTFSVGFAGGDSELQNSRALAARYKTEHREIILKPDFWKSLPSLVWEYGEPFADPAAILTYYISQAAKDFVSVALTGDGGDEMFGGQDDAKVWYWSHRFRKMCPKSTRQWLERNFASGNSDPKIFRTIKMILACGSNDGAIRHGYTRGWGADAKAGLYTPEFLASLDGHEAYHVFLEYADAIRGLSVIDQNLLLTQVGRLPNDRMVRIDIASTKSGIEMRAPFLDYDVARLSESIQPLVKVREGTPKYLLKKLAARHLPREMVSRRKRELALPLAQWLRNDLAEPVKELLLDGEILKQGWFESVVVENVLEQHRSGAKDHTHRIWSLLWLELWHRLFITRTLQPEDGLGA